MTPTTTTTEKVRENRARRMAQRQGLELRKSRRRDPNAIDYSRYWLVNPWNSDALVFGDQWGGPSTTSRTS